MSMHKIPLTSMEEDGLRNHRLPIGTPSQLSDCFRQGMAWALSQVSHVVELRVEYLPPLQVKVRDILSGIDATEIESPDGWWETTTGADFGKRKLDELLALLGQAVQPVALTVDDIMGLAAAMLRAGPNYDGTISELRAAVAALVAERDLAVHEQDVAQESLRQHQVWLQDAQGVHESLRRDAERYRWLRDMDEDPAVSLAAIFTNCNGSAESISKRIDAAVDAAMKEQK